MTAAESTVRLIARTLPVGVRNRYREEWLADIEGSRELGLKAGSVVGAAAITALTMDRTDPSITGIPRAQLAKRRASWAAAFLGSAAVLAVGLFLWGGYQNLSIFLPGPGLVINAVGAIVGLATALFLLFGIIAGIGALTAAADAHGWKLLRYLGLGVIASVVAILGLISTPLFGMLAGVAALAAIVVVASTRGAAPQAQPERRSRRVLLALVFTFLTLAGVTAGVLHITVWNPLAKMPGMTLDEIYAAMDAANQGTGAHLIVAWAVFWSLAAITLPILCLVPRLDRLLSSRRILVIGLLVVGGTVFFQWFAGFGMGMSMADTFMTSGGDAAPTGAVLTILGQVALVAALLVGLRPHRLVTRAGS
ncbi:hypothetical protein BH10ACT7_BH10ACT7_07350 [soil metagenome]